MLPNEEYQRLAARYFPYGNRWLWTMLQYKQMKGMAGENGRAVLRLWLGVIGVCAVSYTHLDVYKRQVLRCAA